MGVITVIDEWEESGLEWRSIRKSPTKVIQIQFFDGSQWASYTVDSCISSLIERLYDEIESLENQLEFAHYGPDEI